MISYNKLINKNLNIHIFEIHNDFKDKRFTLLISKLSEAINPNNKNNQIGEGSTIDNLLQKQKGILFTINAGFNHYKKEFYNWPHNNYNVGDPVGLVKIREHYYEDFLDINNYGFFIQKEKFFPWEIVKNEELKKTEKYILGCTPLLIYNKKICELPNMKKIDKINPPSFLGHGNEIHPRTAVGIKDDKIYFILVEHPGCTLFDLQKIGVNLNLNSFLNLDGGGSSQFRFYDVEKKIYKKNSVLDNDKNRVLGHSFILFDEFLKK